MILVKTALLSLKRNMLRSILTTLGIIIGISAVIIMFALGEGAQRQVEKQIESLGTNLLMVRAGAVKSGGAKGASGSTNKLDMSDVLAIKSEIPEVAAAGAYVDSQAQVVWGNQNWNTKVQGGNADFLTATNLQVNQGRLFDDSDLKKRAKVALIGVTVAKELFGDPSHAFGEEIRINKVPLTIIGVLKEKGQDTRGQDLDDVVVVPLTTANRRIIGRSNGKIDRVSRMAISVGSADDMDFVTEELERLLHQRHRISATQVSPFKIMNLTAMLNTRAEANKVFNMLLAGVAGVSLLVGGIGVMNIMLVSVTERTREIGLRMAVGAKPNHILTQFLIESVVLCLLGALIGVAISLFVVGVLQYGLGWQLVLSPVIITISVSATALIGVGFGFYPAYKASQLDPIEALRYE
ncbi:Macrolide export ATP-binding/permease protein MacB [Vibrio hippocampi]|uniref:Macrolide export ATP-binding/permease protein MacB n=1 Tax=Vibrio hippocampi TaxID=654686 RepID=A0ABN8DL33_9VIBR|nr:ABC transporter permease [Vibrio hippocampi]CAH0530078.1 Macrolide export ATP-binding/permease protein MacB [Vibrio hippocampi]